MQIPRVHSPVPAHSGRTIDLGESAARHVTRVLRLGIGDPIIVFDGSGTDYDAEITACGRRTVTVQVGAARVTRRESPLHATLFQGLCRGSRMDTVIQKATELGIHAIRPVVTARSVVRVDDDRLPARLAHWRGIATSACEQCGRSVVPEVHAPIGFAEIGAVVPGECLRLVLDPEAGQTLPAAAERPRAIALMVGPEGGWSTDERATLVRTGWRSLRLGPRVLRTETAPVVALSVLQFVWGDLGTGREVEGRP